MRERKRERESEREWEREKVCVKENLRGSVFGASENFHEHFFQQEFRKNDGRVETNNRMSLSMRYAQDKSPIRGASSTRWVLSREQSQWTKTKRYTFEKKRQREREREREGKGKEIISVEKKKEKERKRRKEGKGEKKSPGALIFCADSSRAPKPTPTRFQHQISKIDLSIYISQLVNRHRVFSWNANEIFARKLGSLRSFGAN